MKHSDQERLKERNAGRILRPTLRRAIDAAIEAILAERRKNNGE